MKRGFDSSPEKHDSTSTRSFCGAINRLFLEPLRGETLGGKARHLK